ncbi:MAG: TatD family hydrolase, partial [Actinomycetota bacterium]|nr:TatD family hydrolase [Actinomycetota bacterium]
LRDLLAHPKAVAVGETGLDHYRDYAPRERQRDLFRSQAALAAELGKTLVVHTRAADGETLEVLRESAGGTPVVLHCFSASALLEPALEHGWYVSFAGNVTYPNAPELRRAAAQVGADRVLAETDSPHLAPQPVRGRPNEPANVVHTIAALADARNEDAAHLAGQIEANAAAAFDLV